MGRPKRNALDERDLNAIRAIADCDMNVAKAARVVGMRMNTLRNRIARIHEITGLSPVRFYDLQKLLENEVQHND